MALEGTKTFLGGTAKHWFQDGIKGLTVGVGVALLGGVAAMVVGAMLIPGIGLGGAMLAGLVGTTLVGSASVPGFGGFGALIGLVRGGSKELGEAEKRTQEHTRDLDQSLAAQKEMAQKAFLMQQEAAANRLPNAELVAQNAQLREELACAQKEMGKFGQDKGGQKRGSALNPSTYQQGNGQYANAGV